MGCSSSSPAQASKPLPPVQPGTLLVVSEAPPASKAAKGKGKGKGKGGSGGKGKGKGAKVGNNKFQIELSGKWEDYCPEEDGILKRAYLVGQPNAKFHLRGQDYEYSFRNLMQKNLGSGKTRKIRAPPGMTPPKDPLLPPGSIVVMQVPAGGGKSMTISDPNNPGEQLLVAIPPFAKPGTKMAIPVPEKGENVEDVVKRQRGWSTGGKVAAGAAAVGALAVGGVVLGEHLSGGAISGWAEASPELDAAGDWAVTAAADAGAWATDAAGAVGEWAEGAAGWVEGATGDVGEWAGYAVADVGDWAEGAGDWLGDVGEDAADFVMGLF